MRRSFCLLGRRRGRDRAQLLGGRSRHVDLRPVGVARAQVAGRPPLARRHARLDPSRRVGDVHRGAGADHVGAAHPLDRDLDAVLEAGLALPVGGEVERGVVAEAVEAAGVPAAPVEVVERAHLPIGRAARPHAHDLRAAARPRDRAVVAVAPVEADRVLRPEPLGERLVVEPRLAAIGGRRQRQRAGQREPDQGGDAEPWPERQPLEPQEADGQQRQRGAQPQRARPAQRDHRCGGEDEHHGQREERDSHARCPHRAARTPAARRPSPARRRAPAARAPATGRRPRRGAGPCSAPARRRPAPSRARRGGGGAATRGRGRRRGRRRAGRRARCRAAPRPGPGRGAGRTRPPRSPPRRRARPTAARGRWTGRPPSAATGRPRGTRAPRSRRAAPPTQATTQRDRAPSLAQAHWRRQGSPPR